MYFCIWYCEKIVSVRHMCQGVTKGKQTDEQKSHQHLPTLFNVIHISQVLFCRQKSTCEICNDVKKHKIASWVYSATPINGDKIQKQPLILTLANKEILQQSYYKLWTTMERNSLRIAKKEVHNHPM